MKTFTATIFLLAAATSAMAQEVGALASCHQNGLYCGQSLLNQGNYNNHIIETLQAAGQPVNTAHIVNSRFHCGSGGDIFFIEYCARGCSGVGSTDDDYCL